MKPYEPQPLHFVRLASDAQVARSAQFLAEMRTRRSVRHFSTDPVPLEAIKNAIATAATAPSGANQQPWSFVVVQNPNIKHKIRIAAEAEEKTSYERRMSEEWLETLTPLGTDWQKPFLEDAPYLIVVFRQAYGLHTDPESGATIKTKHYYSTESIGIAVGMLIAALHHAGFATLTHTPSPMQFLVDILERPPNERPFMIIPVGFPAEDATVPSITKKAIHDVMTVI